MTNRFDVKQSFAFLHHDHVAAPKIGQQNLEILEELGYARKATMELVRDGIIMDGSLKT